MQSHSFHIRKVQNRPPGWTYGDSLTRDELTGYVNAAYHIDYFNYEKYGWAAIIEEPHLNELYYNTDVNEMGSLQTPKLENIEKLYSNDFCFCALKTDKTVSSMEFRSRKRCNRHSER